MNIQVKNAVLTWDGEPVPKIVDGKDTYPNARRPEWPTAEFIGVPHGALGYPTYGEIPCLGA